MKDLIEKLDAKTLRQAVATLGLQCADNRRLVTLREATAVVAPSLSVLEALGVGVPGTKLPQVAPRLRNATASARPVFASLDFETANRRRDSACATSEVRVEYGRIVNTYLQLIRPPVLDFEFTYIRAISARNVRNALTYRELHNFLLILC